MEYIVATPKSNWSFVSFNVIYALLIFCLGYLFIDVNEVLNSPITTVLVLISPFISVNICLTELGVLMLGAFVIANIIFSSKITMIPLSLHSAWPCLLLQSIFKETLCLICLFHIHLHMCFISISTPHFQSVCFFSSE